MRASVVVCTYNRAMSLQRTLFSLKEMSVPGSVDWELIVIDNNSRDNTKDVVAAFSEKAGLAIRYIFEEKQGLSHARNRGVQEARGDLVAFTDDDIIVDPFWLAHIVKAFDLYDAACVGGKIIPLWSQPRPEWLNEEVHWYLGILDMGDEPVRLAKSRLWGANFAVRSDLFQRYGYFNTAIGRIAEKLYAGEETQFMQALIERGEAVYYHPDIVVHHYIPAEHIRKAYFRKRIYDFGEQIAMGNGQENAGNIMGFPLGELVVVAGKLWNYVWAEITLQPRSFNEQLSLIGNIGYIMGRMKCRDRSRTPPRFKFKGWKGRL